MKGSLFNNNNLRVMLNSDIAVSFLVFLGAFLLFFLIYVENSGVSTLDDHFFHFEYARQIRMHGFSAANDFEGIFFTKRAQNGISSRISGLQAFFIPFTFFSDKLLALKLADTCLLAISLAVFFYTIKSFEVKKPYFYILFLLSSYFFIFRGLAGRAFVLDASLLLLEIKLMIEKKPRSLFFVSLFHFWWHFSRFFFVFLAIGLVEAARYLIKQKIDVKPAGAVLFAFIVSFLTQELLFGDTMFFLNKRWLVAKSILSNNTISAIQGVGLFDINPSFLFNGDNLLFTGAFILSTAVILTFYFKTRGGKRIFNEKEEKLAIAGYALLALNGIILLGAIAINGRFFDFSIGTLWHY